MANEFEITGTVVDAGKCESFGSNGFRKREVVILTRQHDTYPEHVKIEFHGDLAETAPRLDKITATGWITGRLNKDGKCWNALKTKQFNQPEAKPKISATNQVDNDGESLPF